MHYCAIKFIPARAHCRARGARPWRHCSWHWCLAKRTFAQQTLASLVLIAELAVHACGGIAHGAGAFLSAPLRNKLRSRSRSLPSSRSTGAVLPVQVSHLGRVHRQCIQLGRRLLSYLCGRRFCCSPSVFNLQTLSLFKNCGRARVALLLHSQLSDQT